jgi:benzoyl-CoA reductase subunit C
MTKTEILRKIREIAEEPYNSASAWKRDKGYQIVGYYPADFPEELFYAAGFIPFPVFGSNYPPVRADAHLPSFADSLAKSFLHHGLAGDLNFLDALVIPHIDDTTRVIASICKDNWSVPFYQDFIPPKRLDTPLAKSYLIAELQRLREEIEENSGRKITDDALRSAIALYNRNRFLLREINLCRLRHPSVLSNRDFYDIVKVSMLMPKEEHLLLVEKLYHDIANFVSRNKDTRPEDMKTPIVLSGYICEPSQIYDLIDSLQGLIVGDDLVSGSRYFKNDTRENSNPMECIADRLLMQPPSPFFLTPTRREDFLWSLCEEHQAKGVVFLQVKFSETLNYDYPNLRDFFSKRGIPTVLIETDLCTSPGGQIRTYLETFFELIRGI